ncbi:MAG: DUF4214 domain-containing protein [Rhabdaerophilum sp.]
MQDAGSAPGASSLIAPGVTVVDTYQALLSGDYWSIPDSAPLTTPRAAFVTYSFPTRWPSYAEEREPGLGATFRPLTLWEQNVVEQAISAWDAVSGVRFLRVNGQDADIEFSFVDASIVDSVSTPAGYAFYPASGAFLQSNNIARTYSGGYWTSGDVHFDTGYASSQSFASDFLHVALHEIGHALGLKHPHQGSIVLNTARDTGSNSVMSYQGPRAGTLGPMDIQAIQAIYGPNSADGTQVAQWSWDSVSGTLTQTGTAGAEFIRGTASKDVIDSRGGRDAIVTAQGNDTIILYGQVADVNAGSGLDTLVVGLARRSVTTSTTDPEFRWIGLGSESIITDSVERFRFTDGTLAFDLDGNAGQVYRLYQAAFARVPDNNGLRHNLGLVDGGLSLNALSSAFLVSSEFQQRYGTNVSDQVYINALYRNVLQRDADPTGYAGWQSMLQNGTQTRTTMLIGFSESPENIANVGVTIQNGIWFV